MMDRLIVYLKTLLPYGLKHRAKQLGSKLAQSAFVWNFRLYVLRQTPILIYQVGKVGSSSIEQSLSFRDFTFHIHTLNSAILDIEKQIIELDQHVKHAFRQRKWIEQHVIKSSHKAQIITLVRDPIAITVSAFFETLDRHTRLEDAHEQLTLDELLDLFYEKYVDSRLRIDWFDIEFKVATHIDVYNYDFPQEQGYNRIQCGNFDVLLMKLKLDDRVKEKAIAEFIGRPDFKLRSANVGEKKPYAEVYKTFKKRVQIPFDILDMNYNSKHVQHFYSQDEIARFWERWNRNSVTEANQSR